jgi:hypothetical protein
VISLQIREFTSGCFGSALFPLAAGDAGMVAASTGDESAFIAKGAFYSHVWYTIINKFKTQISKLKATSQKLKSERFKIYTVALTFAI